MGDGCPRGRRLNNWGNNGRGDSTGSCPGTGTSVLKWGVGLDGARRLHYRVQARSKEEVPLYPSQSPTPKKHVSSVLMRPGAQGVVLGESTELAD